MDTAQLNRKLAECRERMLSAANLIATQHAQPDWLQRMQDAQRLREPQLRLLRTTEVMADMLEAIAGVPATHGDDSPNASRPQSPDGGVTAEDGERTEGDDAGDAAPDLEAKVPAELSAGMSKAELMAEGEARGIALNMRMSKAEMQAALE